MILTKKLLKECATSGSGFNRAQLVILGVLDYDQPYDALRKGWMKSVIGKEISDGVYLQLLAANRKNQKTGCKVKVKCINEQTLEKERIVFEIVPSAKDINFTPVKRNLSWQEQYNHPNWQKLRSKIFERDNYKCTRCGNDQSQLQVHHLAYDKYKFIWELPLNLFKTVCKECHELYHDRKL